MPDLFRRPALPGDMGTIAGLAVRRFLPTIAGRLSDPLSKIATVLLG